jgi:hypothetical protein
VRSWFQPHTVENGSTSTVSTAIVENTKTKAQSIVQKLAQHERQGDLNNTSSTQNLDVKFGLMPILPTSVQEGSDTMPRGATALGSQLLKLPTGTVLRPPVSRDSSASIESLQPVLETTLMQVSALEVATYSLSASESVQVPTQLGPGMRQHQRSYSDPGQVNMCLIYDKFRWTLNRSPHPTTYLLSQATAASMQVQQAPKNKDGTIWMVRHVLTLVNVEEWLFLCMFLVVLFESYQRN